MNFSSEGRRDTWRTRQLHNQGISGVGSLIAGQRDGIASELHCVDVIENNLGAKALGVLRNRSISSGPCTPWHRLASCRHRWSSSAGRLRKAGNQGGFEIGSALHKLRRIPAGPDRG